ncbi:M48 family metalloprotease [Arenibaculum pallidiluteum]|uniref:M48 family metalloprotease n=1 Tax=Arenibaculum pallidiluteum TaxID=2812559 RepID=UPI001A95CD28|nr:M48 family metalloprotease [Arenibaculum pallidiluteum]
MMVFAALPHVSLFVGCMTPAGGPGPVGPGHVGRTIPSAGLGRRLWRRRSRNAEVTCGLLFALFLLLAACAWMIGGAEAVVLALLGTAAGLLLGEAAAPVGILRALGARPLHPYEAPGLAAMLDELGQRAGLGTRPVLHVVPRSGLQAFAASDGGGAAVAVSTGLLRTFGPREIAAILAHEVSHLRAGDPRLMRLAAGAAQAVRVISGAGLLMALVGAGIPGLPLLAAAPLLGDLLWLRLSREREFDADAGAVALTGDPEGLARALGVLSHLQGESWEAGVRAPRWTRWLRTHPFTRERIRRLAEMSGGEAAAGGVAWRPGLAFPF